MNTVTDNAHLGVSLYLQATPQERRRGPFSEDVVTGRRVYSVHQPAMDFESFYQQEYRSVLGLAYVLVGPQGGAEDITQDAFAKAHQRWSEVGAYENPQAWIRRVLVNQRNTNFRKLTSEQKVKAELSRQRPPAIELSPRSEEVWHAVRSLPERQAQAIALQFWNDMTVREIAETLDCGTETVKTHLKRGRASLAKKLTGQVLPFEPRRNEVSNNVGRADD